MDIAELDYALPDRLIAQRPPARREDARLLVVDRDTGRLTHADVTELPGLLRPSLIVLNDTRVRRARLLGHKPSGGRVELLLIEPLADGRWLALGRASKPIREGVELTFGDGALRAVIARRRDHGHLEVELSATDGDVEATIEAVGHVPLPPYIARPSEDVDAERYQTVFAREPGAVAAPTAGLHFSEASLDALRAGGHTLATVTLHVGVGTFRPVSAARLEDHPMHAERYRVPEATADAIAEARGRGVPIVAIGTTVVRTLEAATDEAGTTKAGEGATDLFIRPPYRARAVDALVTNFHLPRSTLLALVMALAGVEPTRAAYAEAVRAEYRFFSYGDAMLIRDAKSRP
ncbi:MAG: tRNA preQ1(34) S-adenosylmethionine ribosyltransferase-isomerase QueA [Sandaracinaceae bacterium]